MNNNDVLKMLKEEIAAKVDEATLEKLKAAKTPKDALSILESVSVDLSDDMLEAVAGGNEADDTDWCLQDVCRDELCHVYGTI